MKLHFRAVVIAISLLAAGCGGGGGGSTGTSAGTGTGTGTGTGPAPAVPSTPTPTPVLAGTATFTGVRGDYTIARATTGYTVTDRRTNSSTSVVDANAIRFADMTINLGIGAKAVALGSARLNPLIELYMAFLNRVPDADSLSAWIDQLQAGKSMAQIAESLHAQAVLTPSVTGYSATMLNSEFVTAVYKVVFRRTGATAPTAAEVESWSTRIDKGGISRSALMLAMLEAARSGSGTLASAATTQLLDNKITVGDFFAVQQGINYNAADDSVTKTSAIALAVTSTDTAAAMQLIGFADASFNLISGK